MKKLLNLFIVLILVSSFLSAQVIVKNTSKPINPEAGRILKLDEVLRIIDESGEFYFKRPTRIKVADNGDIFIMDDKALYKFNSEGQYMKNLFKEGQGPGEVQMYFQYVLHGADLYIYDSMGVKIIHMDQDGNLKQEYRLMERMGFFVGIIGDDFILSKMDIAAAEVDGNIRKIPIKYVILTKDSEIKIESDPFIMSMYSEGNVSVGLSPLSQVLKKDTNKIFVNNSSEYLFDVLEIKTGKVTKKFSRKYTRVKRPKREGPSRGRIKVPERTYEHDVRYTYILNNKLLVWTSTKDEDKGSLFDVFNEEGEYLDSFYINVKGTLVSTHENFLFFRESDEDGMIQIVMCEIIE